MSDEQPKTMFHAFHRAWSANASNPRYNKAWWLAMERYLFDGRDLRYVGEMTGDELDAIEEWFDVLVVDEGGMSDKPKLQDQPLSYLIRGMLSPYYGGADFPGLAHEYADEIDRRFPVHRVPEESELVSGEVKHLLSRVTQLESANESLRSTHVVSGGAQRRSQRSTVALRGANRRFTERFRHVEDQGD